MNWLKVILFLQILLFSSQITAQNKQLDKANKRYQIKKYAEAIPLYEAGLKKNPNLSAKVRLAYCYRINNNIEKAVNLYSEVVLHKRAKPITWYYYGEALMSQGKYTDAKVWLEKYTEKKPGDPKGWNLIESIDKLQTIQPYYIVENVKPFEHNSESDDSAPIFFRDGIAFSSDRRTGAKIMKRKSSFTGRDFLSIYLSKSDGSGAYKAPSQISRRINDLNKNTGTIALSPDGTMVVFSRNSDVSNRKNQYNLMLYRADVTKDGRFKNVKLMEFCNNNSNHMHPTFSPDGKTIFFTSDKSGVGGTDIFYSTLGEKGWSRARNLDEPINTTANEGFPFMSADGKLFFCSKGHTSYGGFDIFVSEQDARGHWTEPSNIGSPINSPADDISIFLSEDLTKGMFASSREGGDDDIYFFDIAGLYERTNNDLITDNNTPADNSVVESEEDIIVIESTPEWTNEETEKALTELNIKDPSSSSGHPTSIDRSMVNTPTFDLSMENANTIDHSFTKKTNEDTAPVHESSEALLEELNEMKTSSENTIVEKSKDETKEKEILPFSSEESSNRPIRTEETPIELAFEDEIQEEISSEGSNSNFQEGLASIDSQMTDASSSTIENEDDLVDANIMELREFLTIRSPQDEAIFILEKIKFEPKEYTITSNSTHRLDQLVRLMNEFPDIKIEVNAHTSSQGDDRENMVFSIKRATAVAGYLIRRGIGTDRVKVMGYGETQLLNHCANGVNCPPEDHAINQRIELKVLNQ